MKHAKAELRVQFEAQRKILSSVTPSSIAERCQALLTPAHNVSEGAATAPKLIAVTDLSKACL